MGRAQNINHPNAPAVIPPTHVNAVVLLSAIAAKTASFASTGVDLGPANGGYEDSQVLVTTGVVSGTTPTLDYTVQESDDNSTWSDVTLKSDSDAYAQVTATTNTQRVKFKRTKRYLRINATIAGTTPSFTMGAVLLK